ncbi:MAG: hypothetical protein H6841_06120 [Planctomycetes bacterium]|nr:hypothetical protein [Planctomycetota bacterium]
MIRLIASYSKKVPGTEQYSSECASASVEVELPEGAAIPAKLAELWDVTRTAVEQQLGSLQPVNRIAGNGHAQSQPEGNGQRPVPQTSHSPRNGNGRSKAAVSEKQLKFIKSLIGELKPLGCDYPFVEALCQRLFQRGLEYLDRAQASTLIGHLSEIKAGRVTVQQLAH